MDREDVAHTDTFTHTPVHTVEYYSAMKKDETLPFVPTWLDPEDIILSEINKIEKDKCHTISLLHGI